MLLNKDDLNTCDLTTKRKVASLEWEFCSCLKHTDTPGRPNDVPIAWVSARAREFPHALFDGSVPLQRYKSRCTQQRGKIQPTLGSSDITQFLLLRPVQKVPNNLGSKSVQSGKSSTTGRNEWFPSSGWNSKSNRRTSSSKKNII
jgi:hypothetical protein